MKTVLLSYLFVAAGGALGAMARFALNVFMQRDTPFPWGTLAANLLGCLAMGIIAYLVAASSWFNEAGVIPDQYRLLFAVGFCGSFPTLSGRAVRLVFLHGRDDGGRFCLLLPGVHRHAGAGAASRRLTPSSRIVMIRSSHSPCSGFISTERRQVTVSVVASISGA